MIERWVALTRVTDEAEGDLEEIPKQEESEEEGEDEWDGELVEVELGKLLEILHDHLS